MTELTTWVHFIKFKSGNGKFLDKKKFSILSKYQMILEKGPQRKASELGNILLLGHNFLEY